MLATIKSAFCGFLFNWACNNPTKRRELIEAAPPVATHAVVEAVEPVAAQSEDSEAEDRLSAWEQDRAATLNDAADHEKLGLRFLTIAALLRLQVHFEDEGLFVVAHELRQQADALDASPRTVAKDQPALTNVPF